MSVNKGNKCVQTDRQQPLAAELKSSSARCFRKTNGMLCFKGFAKTQDISLKRGSYATARAFSGDLGWIWTCELQLPQHALPAHLWKALRLAQSCWGTDEVILLHPYKNTPSEQMWRHGTTRPWVNSKHMADQKWSLLVKHTGLLFHCFFIFMPSYVMKYDMESSVGSSCVWGEVCQAEYSWCMMCVLKDRTYQISVSIAKN